MQPSGDQPGGVSIAQQCLLSKSSTYLAQIAVVLQGTPDKMLTFTQLMDKLAPLMGDDRKSVENNIRVCLSINKCFVKVPVVPDLPGSKKNYWKLDSGQITAKMARRHFKGLLQLFPELAHKVEAEHRGRPSESRPGARPREPAAVRPQVRFTGSFSINSLLKRDGPSGEAPGGGVPVREGRRDEPRPSVSWRGATRSLNWNPEEHFFSRASAGGSRICPAGGSTLHELHTGAGAVKIRHSPSFPFYPGPHFPLYTERQFPFYVEPPYTLYSERPFPCCTEPYTFCTRPSMAPSFSTPRSGRYSLPTNDALYFRL